MRTGFLDKLRREARERLGSAATDEQITKAVNNALGAHYARMRLASLKARRASAQARKQAETDALARLVAEDQQ